MSKPTRLRLDAIIRRSQHRNGDSARSPDQQREAIERGLPAGAKIVHEHDALGKSGKTMDRADIDAVLERIRSGLTDGAIFAYTDRFSRAPVREALEICDAITEAGGVVICADLNIDTTTPIGEKAFTDMLSTNRMIWRQTAERYEQTRREAIAEGKPTGGAPFGYRFTDPTPRRNGPGVANSRLIVDPDREPIVRELFKRKAGGATWTELTRWLDTVAPKPNGGHWARSTVIDMIACRTYLGEVRSGEYVNAKAHEPIVTPALWRRAQNKPGRRTPRGTYLLSGQARCAGCGRLMRGSTLGRKPNKGRTAPPPRIYKCDTPGCAARSTIVTTRLDAEVERQFFDHLDTFHVRAVDNAELDAARSEAERCTAEVEALAAVTPSHPKAIASHQGALEIAEAALVAAEDRVHDLTASLDADGPDVRELREDWPTLTLDERREILRAGIDAVLVRRGPSPTAKPPAADRVLVLFRGDAPDDLVGARGPVRSWTWNGHPGSLTSTP